MPGLGEREERVRRTALEKNNRPDVGEPARRVECLAKHEAGVEQQQRKVREVADIDRTAMPKIERLPIGRRKSDGQQRQTAELIATGRQCLMPPTVPSRASP